MDDLLRGLWAENPVLVQMLGLCPTLAVTNSVANSLAMGIATLAVLVCSSFLVSSLKRFIPTEVRIASYVLIIATFVTLADMSLEAVVPNVHKALGAFIALIVVNCMILGRAEAFASKHGPARAVLDALGMGIGFSMVLILLGAIRELLGNGTLLGVRMFSMNFEPWVIMVLPPGGFLTLGLVLLAVAYARDRRTSGAAARRAA
ncbi:MAG: electron transport complex subunit E [Gemmatimonadetes bacterium]|nr:electron transport complex subunit E [Gemmatimonadota bacterium]MCC6771778.1 electron transport complex subunit E [Gemmatimonadaceae bacterium]